MEKASSSSSEKEEEESEEEEEDPGLRVKEEDEEHADDSEESGEEEEEEEEEEEDPGKGSNLSCHGLGPPLLGLRNRQAYELRGKPDNLTEVVDQAAYADALNFQWWKPALMIPATLLTDVLLHDHYVPLKTSKADVIARQGNALAVVPLRAGGAEKTLLVHAAGQMLDSVYLSFLQHPEPEDDILPQDDDLSTSSHDNREGAASSSSGWQCSISTARGASLGMGTIQQISRVPTESQDEDDRGGCPLMFMARAGYEAQLFTADSYLGRRGHPIYSVKADYRLKFPTMLSDIACRSSQRIAFITEKNELYEWSSVRGAGRCGQDFAVADGADDSQKPRLAWGCHPRTLWVASGGQLHLVDLRQGRPVKLYGLQQTDLVPSQGEGPISATILSLCRHPTDSNQLFVSADDSLRLMDVRHTRQAVSSRWQSETCSLLSTASLTLPWADVEAPTNTVVVGAGHDLGRIHLHHWPGNDWSPQPLGADIRPLKGIVRSWFGGQQGIEAATTLDHAFFNCDAFTDRNYASHIAGLGVILPPSSKLPFQRVCLPFMNSFGDIYLQQASISRSGASEAPPQARVHGAELPVGVSVHHIQDDSTTKTPRTAPRPSVSIPVDYHREDLRPHKALSMDRPPYGPWRPIPEPTRREVTAIIDEVYVDLTDWLGTGARSLFEVYCHLASLAPDLRSFNYREVHGALAHESAIQGFRCTTTQELAARRQEVAQQRPWIDHTPKLLERSCECHMEGHGPPCAEPDCQGADWWIYSVVGGPSPPPPHSLEGTTTGRKSWSGLSQEVFSVLRGEWQAASDAVAV